MKDPSWYTTWPGPGLINGRVAVPYRNWTGGKTVLPKVKYSKLVLPPAFKQRSQSVVTRPREAEGDGVDDLEDVLRMLAVLVNLKHIHKPTVFAQRFALTEDSGREWRWNDFELEDILADIVIHD